MEWSIILGADVSGGIANSQLQDVQDFVRRALAEDIGEGDVTTAVLVAPDCLAKAEVLAKEPLVVAGCDVVRMVFHEVDASLSYEALVRDGCRAGANEIIMTLEGAASSILQAERTALNFLQRMSGIATLTNAFVQRVRRFGTVILDTRKTTPTFRSLEKYAVRCGGGENHRMGLFDRAMIKDNHQRYWLGQGKGGLDDAIMVVRRYSQGLPVEVEVEDLDELEIALRGNPDWVLLDNMDTAQLVSCVKRVNGSCKVEASGNITLENIEAVASTGVDAISLGCLTHSAPSVDISLEIIAE